VALKVMLPDLSQDEEFVGRFKREAVASSRIGHQNIVDILDFGRTDDGRFYFVMEFLDGLTLAKHLRRHGAFAVPRVVHVGLQAAKALAAAHAQNIIHRDLKPENIMLVQRPGQPDFVKLLDFGIAKLTGGAKGLTMAGMVMGTPQYMAPEQATGLPVDARSDIYQLGLIFHELVTGKPTFTGATGLELMTKQVEAEPPPLELPVPKALDRLIFQMLDKRKEGRPASMEAVVAVLETIASFPTPVVKTAALETRLDPAMTPPSAPPPDEMATVQVPAVGPPPDGLPYSSDSRPGEPPPARPSAPTRIDKAVKSAAGARLRDSSARLPRPDTGDRDDEVSARKVVVRERWPLVVALVALLLAAAGGLAALFSHRGATEVSPPAPAPQPPPQKVETPEKIETVEPKPPEPKVVTVAVTFETEPSQAEVYEGDLLLGNTPVKLLRPMGKLSTLRFEKHGYEPLIRKVRFEADTTMRFDLEKKRYVRPVEDLKDLPF